MQLVLPSCAILNLRQAEPGPDLPASFEGATRLENSSQPGREEFFNDPMLTRLIHQVLVGNRELKLSPRTSRTRRMNQLVSLSNTKQQKRTIAIAIACSFLLVLPSCIPNLRHPAPGPNLPEALQSPSGGSGPDLPSVWKRPARKTQPRSRSKSFSMIRCFSA